MQINHAALKAAQNKAVIARYLGDGAMWMSAYEQIRKAVNIPWYRRKK